MTSTVVQAAIWLLAGGALFVFLRRRKTRKQN
jgi:LPXTG-motif cell wall-anchored protein